MSNTELPAGTPGGSVALPDLPDKMRVHALARRLGATSKEVLAALADLDIAARSPQSSIDRKAAELVVAALRPTAEAPAAEAPAAEAPAAEAPAAETPSVGSPAAEAPAGSPVAGSPVAESPTEAPAPRVRRRSTRAAAPAQPAVPAAEGSAPGAPAPGAPAPEAPAPEAPATEAPAAESAPASRPVADAFGAAFAAAAAGPESSPLPPRSAPSESAAAPLFAPPAPLFQAPTRPAPTRPAPTRPAPTRPAQSRRRTTSDDEEQAAQPAGTADEAAAVVSPAEQQAPAEETPAGQASDGRTPVDQVEDAGERDSRQGPDADDDENGDSARRRRRRGRRGRGRGRGGDDESDEENGEYGDGDDAAAERTPAADPDTSTEKSTESGSDDDSDDGSEDESDDESDGRPSGSRRRRRRRRRGSGDDTETVRDEADPPNTVTRVRQPRERAEREPEGDGVQGVRGSTRLEAKRQRRRDGRDAGRRRVPILSEAEFLARRESVDRTMVVRERGDRMEIGVLEDGVLVEHFVDSTAGRDGGTGRSLVGNIYLGRVQNVLPSMEAAFVDIGRGRNAVLYAGEVDWDAAGLGGKARRIEQALSSGDPVLVQVTKDPIGHKGARLTTQISLAGRFLVYVPGGGAAGISRKLPDTERKRLKDMLKEIVPSEAGVIIRTASEGVSHEALERDVRRLQAQWEVVKEKSEKTGPQKPKAPVLLYEEPDLLIKVVRDQFNEDFSKLVVQGDDAWDTLHNYIGHVASELVDRLHRHVGTKDVFAEHRVDEQLLKALDRKVWLPSGGTLVIDRTEAMTVVDVNTGKYTGSGGNLEETVTRNNLEAAEEVVRQLRLRDIGGIIVIDFIDMVLEANRDLVLRRLTECLSRDRTRHQVAEVTSLGLVQMTRKRVGGGLLEHFSTPCEHCRGRGVVVDADPTPEQADTGRSERSEGAGRRSRGGRGGRRGDGDPVAEAGAGTANGSSNGRPGPEGNGRAPVEPAAVDTPAAAAAAVDAPAPARDSAVVDTPAVDGSAGDTAAGDTAAVDTAAGDTAAVDVGAPVPEAPIAPVSVQESMEEAVVDRAATERTGAVLADVDTGDDDNGHQARPARRRGRVTRTAGAPATGDAPAAVVTVPAAPAPAAASATEAGSVPDTAPQPEAPVDASAAAVPPQPEPAPATTRVRRTRRAASRPAGPPPVVEPATGGDPV